MSTNGETVTTTSGNADQIAIVRQRLAWERTAKAGANWFYWIAAMSVVNSIIFLTGGSLVFAIGLGMTQFVDGWARGLASLTGTEAGGIIRILELALDLGFISLFVIGGALGHKRHQWALAIGM